MSAATTPSVDHCAGERVIDLGAGENPDPRATETADVRAVADWQVDLDERWPWREDSVDMLVANHVLEHVADPVHFFNEAGRVLRDHGTLEVTTPLGKNALMDDDHERVWLYDTPEHYCQDRQRPWDPDTAFRLVCRELDVELHGFLAPLSPVLKAISLVNPNDAAHRCSAGELTARYWRVPR